MFRRLWRKVTLSDGLLFTIANFEVVLLYTLGLRKESPASMLLLMPGMIVEVLLASEASLWC